MSKSTPPWPASKRDAIVDTLHGVAVPDPYRWLEDEKAPDVQAWMAAQDTYARSVLASYPAVAPLRKRLTELFYYDAISAPSHRDGRYFYTRRHADREKTIVYWKLGEAGAETVLFDPNTWSPEGNKGLGGWWPSDDGKRVAYNVKMNNADEAVMYIRDVDSDKDLGEIIPGTKYSGASWTPDGKGFYYTWVPPENSVPTADRPGFAEFRYHKLGTDPAKDPVIYPATKNPQTFLGGGVSRDGKWLLVAVQHGWNSSDYYLRDARNPKAKWTPIVVGLDANFTIEAWKDQLYIHTNLDAPRNRIFKVSAANPVRAKWKEIVPQADATLESFSIVGGKLALTYLRKASSELEIRDLTGKLVRKVALPGLGTSGGIGGEADEDTGYFAFSSFTEPQIIYKTSIKTGAVEEWARVKLPIDTSKFVTEQVWYPSRDGTLISMFIVRSKTATANGGHPTMLYGYGGFNVNETPGYSSSRMVWLEQGGILAIPNLRGGGEYGEEWHRGGMLLNKQNVFDDFIGAAKYLIAQGWTSPKHLAVYGGSNGGLLVGAVMAQAPELFGAVVCAVPLLDMVRYHLFGSGKTWIPEYGSADDPAQFAAIHAYSPYHHIKPGVTYPPLLMMAADHDDRVDPLHARKFVAMVQSVSPASATVLLRIEANAGHGGADKVQSAVESYADLYGFLLKQLR